jgi:alpha-1,2-mannosyltransferase
MWASSSLQKIYREAEQQTTMAAKKAAATPNMGQKTKSKADSSSSSSSLFTSSSTSSNSNKDSGNNNIFFVSYQFGSAFSLLYTAIRIGTANLSPITDCDEVFNYWEPLHFLLYGS